MKDFHQQILLLLSLPIYAVAVPLEALLSHWHGRHFYSWKETAVNVYLNLLNAGIDLLLRGVALVVLLAFSRFAVQPHLHPVAYWGLLFLLEDLLFWTEHFVDHKVRLFWAVHVTHHSSEEYNLTTGFRSSVFMPAYRYLYFIPLVLLGFAPLDILFMYALTQTYGILVHTQAVGKLHPWLEAVLVTPSHHRVHHASNIPYLDKNMGMVLIVWDRLFSTFQEELSQEPPRYGLVHRVSTPHHPVGVVMHEWKALGADMRRAPGLRTKLRYLLRPPGWSHDGPQQTAKVLQEVMRIDDSKAPAQTAQCAPHAADRTGTCLLTMRSTRRLLVLAASALLYLAAACERHPPKEISLERRAYFVQTVDSIAGDSSLLALPVQATAQTLSQAFWTYMAQNFQELVSEVAYSATGRTKESTFTFYAKPDSLLLFQPDSARLWCRLPVNIEDGEKKRNGWDGFFVLPDDSAAADTAYPFPIQPLTAEVRADYARFRESMLAPGKSGTILLFSQAFRDNIVAQLRPYTPPESAGDGSWSISPCR